MGKEWLTWNSELRSRLSCWWFCGREKGREAKTGCETGLIRFGFKSDSSVGAPVAVPCGSDRGFLGWYRAGTHTSSARLKQTNAAAPVIAEHRSAEDMQLHFHPMHQSSWHGVRGICPLWHQRERGGDSTSASPMPATAVLTCPTSYRNLTWQTLGCHHLMQGNFSFNSRSCETRFTVVKPQQYL